MSRAKETLQARNGISEGGIEVIDQKDGMLSQREGLARIYEFLYKGADFGDVHPFILDLEGYARRRGKKGEFYMGMAGRRPLFFYATIPDSLTENTIYAIPKTLNGKGEKPYYWIDFYTTNPSTQDVSQEPYASCRLKPEEPVNKTDYKYWHGTEEQLFADFMLGKNGIQFDDLMPFMTTNTSGVYQIGARGELIIYFRGNPLISIGDRVRFVPKRDEKGLYQWVDIYIKKELNVSQGEGIKVSSYRLLPDKSKLVNISWFGYERQLLHDYLEGEIPITFDDLIPIRVIAAAHETHLLLFGSRKLSQKQINMRIPDHEDASEHLILPRQDDDTLYQWLEVHKIDSATGQVGEDILASARILDGKVSKIGWHGPERQRYIDYIDGNIDGSLLEPFRDSVGNTENREVHLFRYKDKDVKLYVDNTRFRAGDEVEVIPETTKHGTFILTVFNMSRDCEPMRFVFDREDMCFRAVPENFIEDYNIHLYPRVNSETGIYTDEQERMWATAYFIQNVFGVTGYMIKHLSIHPQWGRDKKGRLTRLYNLNEIQKALTDLQSSRNGEKISPEEAREELQKLLEVENE